VAALGGGLVERDGLDMAEVKAVDGPADVELQDAPEPVIGDTYNTGGGDGHLAHQHQYGATIRMSGARQLG
jgi:hypothetical protein